MRKSVVTTLKIIFNMFQKYLRNEFLSTLLNLNLKIIHFVNGYVRNRKNLFYD